MTVLTQTVDAVKTCSGHKKRKGGLTFSAFALGCWHNSRYDGQQIRRPRNPLVKHVEVNSMSKTFAARLNRLFDTVYPPGRGPHTSAEVIGALKAEGVTMSAPYLSQLRSGNRTNPSAATMAALANFFRIKPAYFTDDEYYEKLDKELTWLANMRDEGVRRIAARTVGLSVEAQQDIVSKVDELRRREHLDD
jgi:transcriptional regulator with XRE-family HTH domain